jgi:methionine synthase II (cobalamin-independent)
MFATLSGSYPVEPGLDVDDAIRSVVAVQVEVGLEPVSDGGQRWADPFAAAASAESGFAVAAWRATSALAAGRPVRQGLPGPYSLGRRSGARGRRARERATLAAAERLRDEIAALADAGCPLVWIDERDAALVGDVRSERALFRDAQRRLLEGISGIHPTLAIGGGNADTAGPETFFDAPFHSYFFDLIEGPDNWRLVARLPGDRGVICGAMDTRTAGPADRELLVWAAHYAASTGRRGLDRVGLAPSGGLGHLTPAQARRKVEGLAEAAALAAAPREELARVLDPRAVQGPSARLARRARAANLDRT